MNLETEGIIFRQTKMVQGRRMILLFTKKYGKISVGSNIGDKGRSRTALALRPFTFGNYQIYEGRNYYELDRADAVTNYYGIGEDLDRYAAAAYALELTEKVVPEGFPQPQVFDLLICFLEVLEQRKRKCETLLLAYEVKLLDVLGVFPVLDTCISCGKTSFAPAAFSIKDGGVLCGDCAGRAGRGYEYDGSGRGSEHAGAGRGNAYAGSGRGSEHDDSGRGSEHAGAGRGYEYAGSGRGSEHAGGDRSSAPAGLSEGCVNSGEGTVNLGPNGEEALIFPVSTDIINVVKYYARNPMQKFAGVALSDDVAEKLGRLLKAYIDYHFDLGDLKSESLFGGK